MRLPIRLSALCLWLPVCATAAGPAELDHLSEAQRNAALSQGYSQLYNGASGLRWLDEMLALKFESDATQNFIADLAGYSAELRKELKQLARDYPSLALDDDGLPLLEQEARAAMQRDRVKSLAPLTGAAGAEFERTLLLTQSGALNHLRHLAQVMAQAEKSEQRRRFLLEAERRFDRLYRQVVSLLNERYFCP